MLRLAALAPVAIALWLMLLTFPTRATGPQLDDSWNTLLARALHLGLQAGVDVIFTYGPLAYLFSSHPPFDPTLHECRMGVDCVGKAVMTVALLLPLARLRWRWQQFVYIALTLLAAPFLNDAGWLLTIASLTVFAAEPGRAQALRLGTAGIVCAILAAAKFNFLLLVTAATLCLSASLAMQFRWRAAGLHAAFVLAAFAAVWTAAGQDLGNLPQYLRGSLEITSGYSHAMAVHGPTQPILIAAGVMLALASSGTLSILAARRHPVRLAEVAVLAATAFLCWKAGFVRQDEGHMMILFTAAPLLAFLVPGNGLLHAVTTLLAVALACTGVGTVSTGGCARVLTECRSQAWDSIGWLWAPAAKRQTLVELAQAAQQRHALPATRAAVGSGTVDLMGFEQGMLVLNDLPIRHRPIPQSYSAYTPYLQLRNGEHLLGAAAPDFMLAAVQPIDRHPAMAEDSTAWRALFSDYLPVLREDRYLLLQRRPDRAPGLPEPTATVFGRAALDEWVDLPARGRVHELELDIRFGLAGRARAIAFRPAELQLEVRSRNGTVRTFRIAAPLVAEPFVVDPMIASVGDLVAAWLGTCPRAAAFRVRSWAGGSWWVPGGYDYRLRAVDALIPSFESLTEPQRDGLRRCAFPMFSPPPVRAEPMRPWSGHTVEGRPVLLAEAPMRLEFALSAGKHQLRGRHGLLDTAFTGNGHSDGVTFRIATRTASGDRLLAERHLDPLAVAADRGPQEFLLDVETGEHGTLLLGVDPGPARDNRWDFAWWGSVSITEMPR